MQNTFLNLTNSPGYNVSLYQNGISLDQLQRIVEPSAMLGGLLVWAN